MGANLKVNVSEVNFLRKQKHELNKPILLIQKELESIVEKLVKLCDSQDEKIAKSACECLLDYMCKMTEQRDRDFIQRLMAQNKYGSKTFEVDEEGVPLVDFSNIQDV